MILTIIYLSVEEGVNHLVRLSSDQNSDNHNPHFNSGLCPPFSCTRGLLSLLMKTQQLVRYFYLLKARCFIHSFFLVELHVKTVKYFKSIERVQDEVEETQRALKAKGEIRETQVGSME